MMTMKTRNRQDFMTSISKSPYIYIYKYNQKCSMMLAVMSDCTFLVGYTYINVSANNIPKQYLM